MARKFILTGTTMLCYPFKNKGFTSFQRLWSRADSPTVNRLIFATAAPINNAQAVKIL